MLCFAKTKQGMNKRESTDLIKKLANHDKRRFLPTQALLYKYVQFYFFHRQLHIKISAAVIGSVKSNYLISINRNVNTTANWRFIIRVAVADGPESAATTLKFVFYKTTAKISLGTFSAPFFFFDYYTYMRS